MNPMIKTLSFWCYLYLSISFLSYGQTIPTTRNLILHPTEESLMGTPMPMQILNATFTVQLNMHPQAKKLVMRLIPAGSFIMGSPDNDPDRKADEFPPHIVTITKPFYMSESEVTRNQWISLIYYLDPSKGQISGNSPVNGVTWNDCQGFIDKLNQLGQGTFRLPTEAEWEYACRAGTATRFYWGDDPDYTQIENYAWYRKNSNGFAQEVGIHPLNPFGLYDMSGNVLEWCRDWYGTYSLVAQVDPKGPPDGTHRVLRGGDWYNEARVCRSASRNKGLPNERDMITGFRLVREISPFHTED